MPEINSMKKNIYLSLCLLLCCGLIFLSADHSFAQANPKTDSPQTAKRDGQKDFDFEIGTWKTQLKRLTKPLSGSTTWVEYEGTSVAKKVWNGRANLLERDVKGPAGRIEALSLRLYDPNAHQWSLNFASVRGAVMTTPTIGEFKERRARF